MEGNELRGGAVLKRRLGVITLSEFHHNNLLGMYNYSPGYQRMDNVWSDDDKAFLIDSVLKNYPMPAIFLHRRIDNDTGENRYDIIDGKQRLTAIIQFIKNEIPLPDDFSADGLGEAELNGAYFEDLGRFPDYKRRFWLYEISIEYIDADTPEMVDSIFDRLNRNGAPLTRQELRNARYHDTPLIELVESLAQIPFWTQRLSHLKLHRMEDKEFISELLFTLLEGEIPNTSNRDSLDVLYAKWATQLKTDDPAIEGKVATFKSVTSFMRQLGLDYRGLRIRGVSHIFALWCLSIHCVQHDVLADSIREPVEDLYKNLRWKNWSVPTVLAYRKSIEYQSKSRTQRTTRVEALLKHCGLVEFEI